MRVAVIGATGAVGREMLKELEDSPRTDLDVALFASPRSAGESIRFRGKNLTVAAFSYDKVRGIPFALMSAGGAFSKEHARKIVEGGTTVIDNSSAWRMTDDVPLIVPEVNGDLLKTFKNPGIIANPNCSTIQLVVALKPLHDAFGLASVQVATYQAVSGTGQKGIGELAEQVKGHFNFKEPEPKVYAHPIAFNVIPAIDVIDAAGHCFEEVKVIKETRKIMGLAGLDVLATTARVPTFNCHCEAVVATLNQSVTRASAMSAMGKGAGIEFAPEDDYKSFATPRQVSGDGSVWVSRLRLPFGAETSKVVQFWIVADNLRKGAATNARQIFDVLADQ